jgi:hypothetical protein
MTKINSTEPVWTSKEIQPSRTDIIHALNWYNTEKDEKAAAKYLGVSPTVAKDFQTLAWVTRMISRGFVFPEKEQATIEAQRAHFEEVVTSKRLLDSSDEGEWISIQDRTAAKSDAIIGEIEGLVDDFGIHGNAKKMAVYQWLVDNDVKSIHANRIVDHFRKRSEEVSKVAEGKDKELKEAYLNYDTARLLNLLQCYTNIIKDAQRLAQQTKQARKPRKKKPVSFEKKVSKIKYLVRDDKLKLQSIDPVRIPGSQQLWVYNTKTRKLGVYNALDASGLDVKGSTIKNYGTDSSISKTLRKPEKILPVVVDGGKVALRKVLDGINAKAVKLTGRLNKDTLLLRIS